MLTEILLLVFAGAAGGFVGGLVGVGGGLIFAPVLFFYFQGIGIPPEVIAPLTIGSSLFCTLVVALSAAHSQFQKSAVDSRIAFSVGSASAIAVVLITFFVTTTSWYNASVFELVFASLLIIVALQMFRRAAAKSGKAKSKASSKGNESTDDSIPMGPLGIVATGAAAGVVSTAAGVGGGIVLVPVYHRLFKMSMIRSVGTSSATIVLVSAAGVISYAYAGWELDLAPLSAGYIDVGRALLLSVPAAFTARLGVQTAHRFNQALLRRSFAIVAVLVAIRLLMSVLGFE
ncbi:MAG: sulfite exporter TauE/SafE family protein [Bacteroidetes bacterium]|nr:MAG: sulfite exporter TauE/SafE family protein [Bacteroidota bacterium]